MDRSPPQAAFCSNFFPFFVTFSQSCTHFPWPCSTSTLVFISFGSHKICVFAIHWRDFIYCLFRSSTGTTVHIKIIQVLSSPTLGKQYKVRREKGGKVGWQKRGRGRRPRGRGSSMGGTGPCQRSPTGASYLPPSQPDSRHLPKPCRCPSFQHLPPSLYERRASSGGKLPALNRRDRAGLPHAAWCPR